MVARICRDLPAAGCDSAQRPRPDLGGMTAARYLANRLGDLVLRGVLRHAPRRRDEVDAAAALAYVVPGAEAPAPRDALAELASGRRWVDAA